MKRFVESVDRAQTTLLSEALDNYVAETAGLFSKARRWLNA